MSEVDDELREIREAVYNQGQLLGMYFIMSIILLVSNVTTWMLVLGGFE